MYDILAELILNIYNSRKNFNTNKNWREIFNKIDPIDLH